MQSPQQSDEFFNKGFTKVPEAFSRTAAEEMVDRFWTFMASNQNVCRDNPDGWTEGQVYGISELKKASEFQQIGSPKVVAILDELLGTGAWQQPSTWGQVLATFPAADGHWSWNSIFQGQVDVQSIMWHTDYEYDNSPDILPGVQVFSILDKLDSGGGATLVIENSHQVVKNFVQHRSPTSLKNMKKTRVALMSSDPWLESVSKAVSLQRPDTWIAEHRSTIVDVPVSICELTGEPGDVYFCHPWLLHAPSPNCNKTPRLMCTQRLRRSSQ